MYTEYQTSQQDSSSSKSRSETNYTTKYTTNCTTESPFLPILHESLSSGEGANYGVIVRYKKLLCRSHDAFT